MFQLCALLTSGAERNGIELEALGTFAAMHLTVAGMVVLGFQEIGQNIIPPPTGI